jgi:hypothetical protein
MNYLCILEACGFDRRDTLSVRSLGQALYRGGLPADAAYRAGIGQVAQRVANADTAQTAVDLAPRRLIVGAATR